MTIKERLLKLINKEPQEQDNFLTNKSDIKDWLDNNQVLNYEINDDLTVDVDGDVNIKDYNLPIAFKHIENTHLPIQFNIVSGNFECQRNKLVSLKGSPKFVGGGFFCEKNKLTSLEYAPKKVCGSYHCDNNRLTSLKHAPIKIGGDFNCDNNRLNSLEHAPEKISGDFSCNDNKITSLEFLPKNGITDLCINRNLLTTLEHMPLNIEYDIYCSDNPFIEESLRSMNSNEIKKHLGYKNYDRWNEISDDEDYDLEEVEQNTESNEEDTTNDNKVDSNETEEVLKSEEEMFVWINYNDVRHDKENIQFISRLRGEYLKPKLVLKDETIFDRLESEFPNFKKVIEYYKAQFRLSLITKDLKITPALLLGNPGIGKTMFVKKLAEYINTGFTFIDMGSATSSFVLNGLSSSWHGAKQGKAFDAMLNSNTASPIILLDELEKCSNPDRDPKIALYQLLEESNSSRFVDEFVNFPTDLSKIIYIASANSTTGIPDALLSRFMVFDIPNPTAEEQALILQTIYKTATRNSTLFEATLDNTSIDCLVNDSLREAKIKINNAVSQTLLNLDMEHINDNDRPLIKICSSHFEEKEIIKKSIGF